jgi:A/G-specific adenine glycosylase
MASASPRAKLLRWYDVHARDLPWRHTRDPYRVWVSEVMLQQTRVETVLRYYAPFLRRFPTLRALARAPEDRVMAAWSGLGYYRRARLLHAGVRAVVARHGGRVPEHPEARWALPGVGRYTAGAIGSIAFGREEAVVDGNVARVLSRVHRIETPLGRADTDARLWREAERLVQGPRPGDFNQALMELGATVCSRSSPACARCPLRSHCRAYATGAVERLPVARKRRAPRAVDLVALVVSDGAGREARVWLERARGSLYGGLWNLPLREGRGPKAARTALAELGLRARLEARAQGDVEHVLTHRRLRAQVWRAHGAMPTASGRAPARLRSQALARLDDVGTSALTRKALAIAGLTSSIA